MAEARQIHFTGDIVSRNKGQSAVEHAAYRSGEKLYLDREGETFDYTRKRGVLYSEIMLADHAPSAWKDRQALWNAVEDFEKKCDAQLARSLEFSLPFELSLEENIALCKEVAEYYRKQGMCVDFCIHAPDKGNKNIHCHMMLTLRPLTLEGEFVLHKSHREYILDENGQKIPNKSGKDYRTRKVNIVDWDDKGNMEKWRANYAQLMERYLKNHGLDVKVEHRSFEKQGIHRIPTIHMGPAVAAMEKKGIRTRVGDMNREIKLINEILERGDKVERELDEKIRKLDMLLERQKAAEAEEAKKANTIEGMLLEYQRNRSKFIQDAGIHEKRSTKTENLQDFATMYAYLQANHIETLDDLQKAVEAEKDRRRDAIHSQNAISKRQKDMESLITAGENYKPLKKYHKTLETLQGAKRQEFMDKYYDQLQLADSWRAAIKHYTGKTLFQPSKWNEDAKKLKSDMADAKKALQDADSNIEMLSDILDMVSAVDTARQVAKRKEQQRSNTERTSNSRSTNEQANHSQKKRNDQSL
ncbi:MAG: MobA/MobL family protein [Lachnospiraceae bacterium]|nr:MobA/MobL family protein [Lachnospiraceae bacterium]